MTFLSLTDDDCFYGGAAGGGKLLRLDEPIPTPSGWTTMGALRAGDLVFDEYGQPCRVTVAFAPETPRCAYRLTLSDGSEIEAGEEHRWLTFDASELAALTRRDDEWRAARRDRRPSRATGNRGELVGALMTVRNRQQPPATLASPTGTVRSTAEIAATLRTASGRVNHAIPVAAALDLPEALLPIDPFLLGVWLGDGDSRRGHVTTDDPEILNGFPVVPLPSGRGRHYRVIGLTTMLRRSGLLGAKRIPPEYLRASRQQRLALLQGLMDTDGTVAAHSGAAEFTTTNPLLAAGVCELIVSLGWKVRLRESRARLAGRDCGPKWTMKWMANAPVFRLARKLARQKLGERRTLRFRYIVGCEPVGPVMMRCIEVDSPSRLYLAGRAMVPTHNSDALLMDHLIYADEPGYSGLILRRTRPELRLSGGLIQRAQEWVADKAKWSAQDSSYTFKNGGTLTFGYMESSNDRFRYSSAEFDRISVDEVGNWPEDFYDFLKSRIRHEKGSPIPSGERGAGNPGGIGENWLYQRYVDPLTATCPFVPATLEDMRDIIDTEHYERMLDALDPVTRAQLRFGVWMAAKTGKYFQEGDFYMLDRGELPQLFARMVRFWDIAATSQSSRNSDPDYMAGVLMARDHEGLVYVLDVVIDKLDPGDVEDKIRHTAMMDGTDVSIVVEQEPGSSGKLWVETLRKMLRGYSLKGVPSTGSKITRAKPWSSAVSHGEAALLPGHWTRQYVAQHVSFGQRGPGIHDDCVDASSGAYAELMGRRSADGLVAANETVALPVRGLAIGRGF